MCSWLSNFWFNVIRTCLTSTIVLPNLLAHKVATTTCWPCITPSIVTTWGSYPVGSERSTMPASYNRLHKTHIYRTWIRPSNVQMVYVLIEIGTFGICFKLQYFEFCIKYLANQGRSIALGSFKSLCVFYLQLSKSSHGVPKRLW